MPVLVNEVISEIVPVPPTDAHPKEEQTPLDTAKFEIAATLDQIEERRLRLRTD
jgi:hypothetical protein